MTADANYVFYSYERQDEFIFNLLGSKGTFLDIGCSDPEQGSNTFALEHIGWQGFCIDIRDCEQIYNWSSRRKSAFIRCDITNKNYFSQVLDGIIQQYPVIDYLSIDVDSSMMNISVKALETVLEKGLIFKALTFEHEYHYHGDQHKKAAKELLEKHNYVCLINDVIFAHEAVPPSIFPGKYFEDWYINPKYFDSEVFSLMSSKIDYNECISRVKTYSRNKYVSSNPYCKGKK